jgi:murein DD-endopeptidase MepM/ murein hydrolase activator NlpD
LHQQRDDNGGDAVHERSGFYTVLIIPGAAAKVRRLQFPVPWVKKAAVAGAVLGLVVAGVGLDYALLRLRAFELESLRRVNEVQKSQITQFEAKIGDLEAKMKAIESLDSRLRQITGLGEKPRPDRAVAVGGGASLEEQPAARLEPGRQALIERMHRDLEKLSADAEWEQTSLKQLEAHLEAQRVQLASTPSIWPVRGWLTSDFGPRYSPFTETNQMHEGIDVAGPIGTAVKAPAAGVVIQAGVNGSYGNYVAIDHGYGIQTRYGHLNSISVKVGQRVKRHQPIATLGNSGRSTGPHLHYEVRVNNVPVNPAKYILD